MKINSLLAATLAFVLVAGLGTPAFAGVIPFDGEDNTVWVDCFVIDTQSGVCSITVGPSNFELSPLSAIWDCTGSNCNVRIPNFIDPLPLKLLHITTDFAEVLSINGVDPDVVDDIIGVRDSKVPNGDGFIEEWRLEPNPDFEIINFQLISSEASNIEIHTVSKDVPSPPTVGGEFLPIDSTALVLAGLQSSAIWMLPVLAGAAGVGAYYIKTRMNKDN